MARQLPKLRPARTVIAVILAVGISAFAVALASRSLATIVPVAQTAAATDAPCPADTGAVAEYRLVPGTVLSRAIGEPLAGWRGDPERGVRWVVSAQRGHCIACHEIPSLKERIKPEEPGSRRRFGYHGTVGPSLEGVASRYTEGEMRLLIVDPSAALPAAIKPAYHRIEDLHGVDAACAGKPILSATQVEDIVAFLRTLK